MTLDQFDKETNLLGTFVFLSFKMKEILDTRIDLIQHPFLLTYVSIFYFYRSVLLQIKIYQVKLHQTRNIKDLFYYTEYSNEAKKIAKETYINNELLEKKLKVNLKDKFNDIFYILHFGHIINLEYLTLPFSSEACSVSNHFSCKIIEKIQGLAKYWPIYTNFMAKAKGCNSGSGVLKK
ncbi:hypothetical protein K502DRAFT_158695 [Neoconidiobolus thromboides FSU 785]|nr:hypothetical protein K502DRAFT_158695 [Neoconidiobolus thromboides FSU 785]